MSNSASFLARMIAENGGVQKTVMGSSGFIEATCGDDETAQEYGFLNAKDVIDLWDDVCNLV